MPSSNFSAQADHPAEISIQLLISGQVQGVGFRAATERQARLQQIKGWVRNRFDGRVEVVIEGSLAAVEAMVSWCHHGDPPAQVTAVEQIPLPPQGFAAFIIRPTLRG
ncbi:MAG: acylphosphatase [Synechococcaceae cyanobacterium RM1_1_27]|nr:acylphosphatase [Synechococcaceae cyanobacterium SM2_3_2]NJO85638.1 acylphosphatase [Synechococcaceae cyanobacterium RM1_1_27]